MVVGQGAVLDHLLAALLCRGHALMVGVPGLGKTLMAKTIAQHPPDELQPNPIHSRT